MLSSLLALFAIPAFGAQVDTKNPGWFNDLEAKLLIEYLYAEQGDQRK